MTTIVHRESAKIYAFPVKGRVIAGALGQQAKFAAEVAALRASRSVAVGDACYHDAAIKDEREPKR